jgi:uncharacterized protein (TIGR00299 family) protein
VVPRKDAIPLNLPADCCDNKGSGANIRSGCSNRHMRLCFFDAFSGIAGDMTVGALLDAGADAGALVAALSTLGAEASYRVEKTKRRGIAATKFHVDVTSDPKKHRHLHHIVDMIEGSAMSPAAKATSRKIFHALAEAEAQVHGSAIEKVHFHEVGAVDSIADICGAAIALDLLGIEQVACSPVNTGSGTVNTEHGVLPVPTPATALLLTDRPVYARGPEMELTTPTGAAIVAALANHFGPPPPMRIKAIGYGAGDRDFKEHSNVLRVILGEIQRVPEATAVAVLEANIDDSTPEVLGYAMERLLEAGALDVTLSPIMMKKNRPGTLLRVVAQPHDREMLANLVLRETSTLGLRVYEAERRVEPRESTNVATRHGTVRMKVAANGNFAPEFEDCRQLARESGIPLKQIIAEANSIYLQNISK